MSATTDFFSPSPPQPAFPNYLPLLGGKFLAAIFYWEALLWGHIYNWTLSPKVELELRERQVLHIIGLWTGLRIWVDVFHHIEKGTEKILPERGEKRNIQWEIKRNVQGKILPVPFLEIACISALGVSPGYIFNIPPLLKFSCLLLALVIWNQKS